MQKLISVPTGHIGIMKGSEGKMLEFVSLGDYGAENNLKADFLGHTKPINGVTADKIKPLSEKWVITISTQYGCSMGCRFCDVPKVGPGLNCTELDMVNQIRHAMNIHPEITETKRLNIHYARMGEPSFNPNVLSVTRALRYIVENRLSADTVHPVVSTMCPEHAGFESFVNEWVDIKNGMYNGEAGLQLSINSTDNIERRIMFNGNAMDIEDIARIADKFAMPNGRKYTLNFALSHYEINAQVLAAMFDPKKFLCKITPVHETTASAMNGIRTVGGYHEYAPYTEVEESLKSEGFDVIVFIPSLDEDMSRITCGNAILSDAEWRQKK